MKNVKESKKKTKWMHLRISERDYDKFKKVSEEANLSMSEILRGDIRAHVNADNPVKIFHLEKEMIEMIDNHISRIGNNLNQTAKALNTMNKSGVYNGEPPYEETRKAI